MMNRVAVPTSTIASRVASSKTRCLPALPRRASVIVRAAEDKVRFGMVYRDASAADLSVPIVGDMATADVARRCGVGTCIHPSMPIARIIKMMRTPADHC